VAQEKWRSIACKFGLKIKPEGEKRKKEYSDDCGDQEAIRPARGAGGRFGLDSLNLHCSDEGDPRFVQKSSMSAGSV
jgi:hypothetical protein